MLLIKAACTEQHKVCVRQHGAPKHSSKVEHRPSWAPQAATAGIGGTHRICASLFSICCRSSRTRRRLAFGWGTAGRDMPIKRKGSCSTEHGQSCQLYGRVSYMWAMQRVSMLVRSITGRRAERAFAVRQLLGHSADHSRPIATAAGGDAPCAVPGLHQQSIDSYKPGCNIGRRVQMAMDQCRSAFM